MTRWLATISFAIGTLSFILCGRAAHNGNWPSFASNAATGVWMMLAAIYLRMPEKKKDGGE